MRENVIEDVANNVKHSYNADRKALLTMTKVGINGTKFANFMDCFEYDDNPEFYHEAAKGAIKEAIGSHLDTLGYL